MHRGAPRSPSARPYGSSSPRLFTAQLATSGILPSGEEIGTMKLEARADLTSAAPEA